MSRGSPIMFFNPVIPTQNFVQSGFPRIIFGIPSKHTFNPESHSNFVFKSRIPSLIQIREISGAEKPLGTLCPVLFASTERAIEKSNNILCINSDHDSHTLSIADSKRKTKISCTSCNFRLSLRALRWLGSRDTHLKSVGFFLWTSTLRKWVPTDLIRPLNYWELNWETGVGVLIRLLKSSS